MKHYILYIILINALCVSISSLSQSFEWSSLPKTPKTEDERVLLVCSFLETLFQDSPFSVENEQKFFPPAGGILGLLMYRQAGFFDLEKEQWKIRPHYSYFGELIKLHRDEILAEKNVRLYIYISPNLNVCDLPSGKETVDAKEIKLEDFSYATVIVKRLPYSGAATADQILFFTFRKFETYKIELNMSYCNAKAFSEILGFKIKNNRSFYLPDDDMQMLKEHMKAFLTK